MLLLVSREYDEDGNFVGEVTFEIGKFDTLDSLLASLKKKK